MLSACFSPMLGHFSVLCNFTRCFNTWHLQMYSRRQNCVFPTTALPAIAQCNGEELNAGNTLVIFAVEYLQLKKSQNLAEMNKKQILFWSWRTQTEFNIYCGLPWVPDGWKVNELVAKLHIAQSHKIRYVIVSLLGINTTKIWIERNIWVPLEYFAHKLTKTSM